MTMIQQLFKLRGELPPRTFMLIEIIGVIVLLVIWQLVASIGTTQRADVAAQNAVVYYEHGLGDDKTAAKPYILLYDRPLQAETLVPLVKSLSGSGSPLVLFSAEPNQRVLQFLSETQPSVPLVGVRIAGSAADTYRRVADFAGATLLDNAYFAEIDSSIELSPNVMGRAALLRINPDQSLSLENRQELVSNSLLPSPIEVVQAFKPLLQRDNLVGNTAFSVYLNLLGYLLATLIALPVGFAIGLFPIFRALFHRNIDALRFVPLTAVTGLFIAWFGIETQMKVAFLAFGIIVYLLPVVVQRVREVEEVYVQTAYTLGASKWQQIRTVFIPAVLSRVSDDVRVLVAISWTYIIVAELVNANSGGIGALAFKSARQSSIDKVFALLLVIIIIGFIQDKLFLLLDRILFPYKSNKG